MARKLDNIVIQLAAIGGSETKRILAQQLADPLQEPAIPHKVFPINIDDLPAPQKAAYNILEAYLQTELDNA